MTASLWKDRKKLKTLYNIQQNPSPTYHKKILRRFIEKLSLFIPFRRRSSGGMTVEATIVLPICIFFLLNLGSAVEMIRLHNHLQLALWDSGRRIALYGCEYCDKEVASLISAVYLKAVVTEYVGKEYLDNSPLENGSESLRFWESRMLESDKLDIRLTYAISPPVSLAGFRRFRMSNRYFVHLGNGSRYRNKGRRQRWSIWQRTVGFVIKTGSVHICCCRFEEFFGRSWTGREINGAAGMFPAKSVQQDNCRSVFM